MRFRRWVWIGFFALLVFAVARCVPEKPVDRASMPRPQTWLDEDTLAVSRTPERVNGNVRIKPHAGIGTTWALPAPNITASYPEKLRRPFVGRTTLKIDGIWHGIAGAASSGQIGDVGGKWRIPALSYRSHDEIGLIMFEAGEPVRIPLPLIHPRTMNPPLVVWDAHMGRFFAYQKPCTLSDGLCPRTAWWLSPELEVLETFALPEQDLVATEEGALECFSCGCSCYTREYVYAVNGEVYFLAQGFPLAGRRGLYRVERDGPDAAWQHAVEGRMEPPLVFSPSGCRVAYYKVSRWGDRIETPDICG